VPSDRSGPGTGGPAADDHGASAERTRFAWRRTGLSAAAVGLLAARTAVHPDAGDAKWLIAALAMAGWATLIGLAYRRAGGLKARPPLPGRRAVTAYAFVTAALAVLAGLVVIL
jgi:hypothetical protein